MSALSFRRRMTSPFGVGVGIADIGIDIDARNIPGQSAWGMLGFMQVPPEI